jgi:hypothetical protein
MHLPGFNAELTLNEKIEDYRGRNNPFHSAANSVVIPQVAVWICWESEERQQSICRKVEIIQRVNG